MTEPSKISRALSLIASIVLVFLMGAWLTHQDAFPYRPYLERAFFSFETHLSYLNPSGDTLKKQFWSESRFEQTGVTEFKEKKTYDGLTFYCSRDGTAAKLIDLEGNEVHTWSKSFGEAWPTPSHMPNPAESENIIWDLCHLFPNGDILAVFKASNHFPGGHGMIKLDVDSNVEWKYGEPVHHDVEVESNGQILTLIRESSPLPESLDGRGNDLAPQIFESSLVLLSPDGRELKRISLIDALLKSEYSWIATAWQTGTKPSDPFHFNNVERVPKNFADKVESVDAGDILLSARDLSAFLVLDPKQERIVWAQTGYWSTQHDPDFVNDGNILFFDNLGLLKRSEKSRVVEYDPGNYEMLWSYDGSSSKKLFSFVMGEQQPLPNGNVLIAESREGRILEVTQEGEIVWEYIHPVREPYKGEQWIPSFSFGVKRYPRAELTFID